MSNPRTALIVVDVQNDFLPSGSLAVPDGDAIKPVISQLLDPESYQWDIVIASQDWHLIDHISFANNHPDNKVFDEVKLINARGEEYIQKLWPIHCIQNTHGSEIAADLQPILAAWGEKYMLVRKGWNSGLEAYSAFEGYITSGKRPSPPPIGLPPADKSDLAVFLHDRGVDKVVTCGLATDYCVGATTVSSIKHRFDTAVVAPASRAISEKDGSAEYDKIRKLGGTVIDGDHWQQDLKSWMSK